MSLMWARHTMIGHGGPGLPAELAEPCSCQLCVTPARISLGLPCSEGLVEYYWGDHIHLGFYTEAERAAGYKRKDFKQAKRDFVEEMLRFSQASRPHTILDVGCGIGGTSRLLASKFPDARITGWPAGYHVSHIVLHAGIMPIARRPHANHQV